MILFLYNLALLAALVLGSPWWLFRMATTHKYRDGLLERLGRVPARIKHARANSGEVIWVHAVSVGEVLAVSRLVAGLGEALPEFEVMISTTTLSGQTLARERFGEHRVFYCPLDLPWAVNSYLNALQPRLLILAETEFWPNLLSGCYRRNIPVAVVNARISDRSWPRYLRLRRLWRPLLQPLSLVLAQSQTDADRLMAIGCAPVQVGVAGNLKFDVRAAEEAKATRYLRVASNGLRLIVAGSTLDGEEAALLEIWPQLLETHPDLVLVLAPRHPERFGIVADLLEKTGVSWVKRSDWESEGAVPVDSIARGQVVLLDSIGELASVYSLASIAFIGGSLIPAGGHNPLEPAQFGVPIVMGPHYANFRAISEDLLAHHALRIATKQELAVILIELLTNPAQAQEIGERARLAFNQQAGTTQRCVAAIQKLLAQPAAEPQP